MNKKNESQKKALKVKTNLKPGAGTEKDFSAALSNFVGATKELLLWPWGQSKSS